METFDTLAVTDENPLYQRFTCYIQRKYQTPSLQWMKIRYIEGLSVISSGNNQRHRYICWQSGYNGWKSTIVRGFQSYFFCPLYPKSGILRSVILRVYCVYISWLSLNIPGYHIKTANMMLDVRNGKEMRLKYWIIIKVKKGSYKMKAKSFCLHSATSAHKYSCSLANQFTNRFPKQFFPCFTNDVPVCEHTNMSYTLSGDKYTLLCFEMPAVKCSSKYCVVSITFWDFVFLLPSYFSPYHGSCKVKSDTSNRKPKHVPYKFQGNNNETWKWCLCFCHHQTAQVWLSVILKNVYIHIR